MKKIFLMVIVLVGMTALYAGEWTDFGVRVGLGVGRLHGDDNQELIRYDLKHNGISAGSAWAQSSEPDGNLAMALSFYGKYNFYKGNYSWNFQPEVQLEQFNYTLDYNNGSFKTPVNGSYDPVINGVASRLRSGKNDVSLMYVHVPLLIQVETTLSGSTMMDGASKTESHLGKAFLFAGPSIGFMLGNDSSYSSDLDSVEDYIKDQPGYTYTKTDPITDQLKSLEAGVDVGIGWQFNKVFGKDLNLEFDWRNHFGIMSIGDIEGVDNSDITLQYSLVTIGYKF